ncbi:Wzz/FepE/Etk N-terminal domain-containing protein [Mucilaginibacter sp.]|uniref:Wzz/FepE/Etk N-terminal domain-containing protein n=1 Tax=Mucilaginibacter sp. TaxID=1882438 RepID=UPI003D09673B
MVDVTKDTANRQPDELTVKNGILKLKAFNSYLYSKWLIIGICSLIGGLTGLLYAILKKPVYTAEYTFVISEGTGSHGGALTQYSALASMAGIDMGGNAGLFEGDNIIELYKSRSMLIKALLTKVSFPGKQQLLIDKYFEINKIRSGWKNNSKLSNITFDTLKGKFGLIQDSLMIMAANDINKNYLIVDKPDKKLSIISVKVASKDALFAKAFTETIVSTVNKFYIETKTHGSLQNLHLFEHQVDSVRHVLNSSISGSASAIDANPDPNPVLQVLRVPSQKKQIDIQANTALYTEAVKNLEVSRSMLQRETPLIQVVDGPMLPLPNDRLSKSKGIIYGVLIAFMLTTVMISVRKLYSNILR